jgi:putative photosynthetic complex assembly protein
MSAQVQDEMLPRGLLIGAGLLVATALAVVTLARLTGYQPMQPDASTVVTQEDVRFEDRRNGAIAIYSGQSDRLVDTLAPGTNGFVRGVMRGLARDRRAEHIGERAPFRLTHWANGRLSLDDPSTGRHIDLEVFGMTNAGAFAEILTAATQAKETP